MGDIDQRADVYSLAHIAYALLVGSAYWETEARSTASVYPLLMKIVEGAEGPATQRAAARGASLPASFDAWFAKATASDPRDRFATASDSVRELSDVLGVDKEGPGREGPGSRRLRVRPEVLVCQHARLGAGRGRGCRGRHRRSFGAPRPDPTSGGCGSPVIGRTDGSRRLVGKRLHDSRNARRPGGCRACGVVGPAHHRIVSAAASDLTRSGSRPSATPDRRSRTWLERSTLSRLRHHASRKTRATS